MDLFLDLRNELVEYFQKYDEDFSIEKYVQPIPDFDCNSKENDTEKELNKHRYEASILLERYINYKKRNLLTSEKKTVYKSKELQDSITKKSFSDDIMSTINKIEEELEKGLSVSPRLSKRVKDISYDDKMLNDWNIYHFHLSDIDDVKSGFKQRTGELLFVYIPDKTSAYFLDVTMNHKDKTVFSNIELLNLIDENWPSLLDDFVIERATNFNNVIKSKEDCLDFRDENINGIVQLRATKRYIIPVGWGLTAAGTSVLNKAKQNKIVTEIQHQEKILSKYENIKLYLQDDIIIIKNISENQVLYKLPID